MVYNIAGGRYLKLGLPMLNRYGVQITLSMQSMLLLVGPGGMLPRKILGD